MSNRATARNFQSNASSPAEEQRKKMLARIHMMFPRLRPDLRHSPDEMKQARLEFVNQILNWRKSVTSMRSLKPTHRAQILDAMSNEIRNPSLWGYKNWIEAGKLAGAASVTEHEPALESEQEFPSIRRAEKLPKYVS